MRGASYTPVKVSYESIKSHSGRIVLLRDRNINAALGLPADASVRGLISADGSPERYEFRRYGHGEEWLNMSLAGIESMMLEHADI